MVSILFAGHAPLTLRSSNTTASSVPNVARSEETWRSSSGQTDEGEHYHGVANSSGVLSRIRRSHLLQNNLHTSSSGTKLPHAPMHHTLTHTHTHMHAQPRAKELHSFLWLGIARCYVPAFLDAPVVCSDAAALASITRVACPALWVHTNNTAVCLVGMCDSSSLLLSPRQTDRNKRVVYNSRRRYNPSLCSLPGALPSLESLV